MKVRCVSAKGKHTISLQDKLHEILREAEEKLLDATLDVLRQDEQQYHSRCTEKKQQIATAIETWKDSFKTSESSLEIEVEQFVVSAKQFADEFYFECVAIRTSKQVVGSLKQAEEAQKNTERMETEFQPNEQSINDMVARAVQKEFSKLKNVSAPAKKKQPPRNSSGGRRKSRSTSRNGTRNGKKQAKGGPSRSSSAQRQSQNAQGRRSRSRTNRQTPQSRVTFHDSRRKQSKNSKSSANGAVR